MDLGVYGGEDVVLSYETLQPERNQAGFARRRLHIIPHWFLSARNIIPPVALSSLPLREPQRCNGPRTATSVHRMVFEDFQDLSLSYDGQVASSMAIKANRNYRSITVHL